MRCHAVVLVRMDQLPHCFSWHTTGMLPGQTMPHHSSSYSACSAPQVPPHALPAC